MKLRRWTFWVHRIYSSSLQLPSSSRCSDAPSGSFLLLQLPVELADFRSVLARPTMVNAYRCLTRTNIFHFPHQTRAGKTADFFVQSLSFKKVTNNPNGPTKTLQQAYGIKAEDQIKRHRVLFHKLAIWNGSQKNINGWNTELTYYKVKDVLVF